MTFINGTFLASNSEAGTFQDCPRRWWLAWHRGLVPKHQRVDGARSTGTRYHAALASWYVPEGQERGNPVQVLRQLQDEDLLKVVHVDENDEPYDPVELRKQFELEEAMVTGYLQWLEETGVDENIEVIAPETYVEAAGPEDGILGYPIKMIGKLDAKIRFRNTGQRGFIDHKTVATLHDPTLMLNRQMLHYLLIDWLNDTAPITPAALPRATEALYNMARKVKRTIKAKPPFYQRVIITHNADEIASYNRQLQKIVRTIILSHEALNEDNHHSNVVPARPSRDCAWKCDFFKICRMFDDGSRVSDAIRDLYEERDPLEYYGGQEKVSE